MKIKKALKTAFLSLLALLAVLVIALAVVFFFWLGPAIKLIAENVGSKALGAPVTIELLAINPREGTLQLRAFHIASPEGFEHAQTIALAGADIAIDMNTVFSDTIVIKDILIDGPHFVYEQNQANDNIAQFMTNVFAFAKIDPNALKKTTAEREEASKSKQVIVENLRLTDVRVALENSNDHHLDLLAGFDEFSLSMTNGVALLKNLTLSNPDRVATPNLFELEAIKIKLDPASIYSGTVVIEDIRILKPYTFLEQNPESNTVAEFMKIAESFAAKAAPKPTTAVAEPAAPPSATAEAGPPPVELRHLLVDDIQIKLLDTTRTNAPAGPQTMASIGSIAIRLVEGQVHIGAITIPNLPAGFTTTNLFHLAGIDITIDPASIYSKQVVIKNVFVDTPLINLEQTDDTGNVYELQKLAQGFAPPPSAPISGTVETAGTAPAEPVRIADQPVVLESLVVTNFAINMVTPVTTNGTLAGAVDSGKAQLSKLNPMQMLGSSTNAPDTAPLTLLTFAQLSVEPLKGRVQITNLQVGNPKGFANKNLVQLDTLRIDLDPDTLQSRTLLIEDILIEKPRIAYERQLTTDNIKALQAFITSVVEKRKGLESEVEGSAVEVAAESTEPASSEAGQKVIITHVLVKDGLVKAKISLLPSAPIPLPNIEMNDLGKETGGTSFGAALSNIGTTLYDAIIGSVSSVTGFAGDALKGAGTLTFGALGTVTGGATDKLGKSMGLGGESNANTTEEPEAKPKPRRIFHKGGRF